MSGPMSKKFSHGIMECPFCHKEFKSLGIASHRARCREKWQKAKLEKMAKEVREVESGVVYCVSSEVQELTKDIPCPWCPAKEGQPCFIQIPAEEQELLHKTYRPGSDYIPERIHLARWKQK